jgi:hypothetical protein
MARTLNGNLTGRAAVTDRQDWINDVRERNAEMIADRKETFRVILNNIKELDPKWEVWFDATFPEVISWKNDDAIRTLKARENELVRAKLLPSPLMTDAEYKQEQALERDRELEIQNARNVF